MTSPDTPIRLPIHLGRRAHLIVLIILQVVLAIELVLLIARGRWMHVFLVIGVMIAILSPELLKRRMRVEIPSEIQITATLFVFASFFLGEVRDYYERIWWWDQALHASAGLLLGLLGFVILHVLNSARHVDLQMRPVFVAMFAFLFSVSVGALWEIFEFAMDQGFGLNMQKPMLGDPSGLTDTMWDLILNTAGAALISIAGWHYIKRARTRPVDTWVGRLIRRNRRITRRRSGITGV